MPWLYPWTYNALLGLLSVTGLARGRQVKTFMVFGQPNGIAGDVTTEWTDRNVMPYYRGTWASIRRVGHRRVQADGIDSVAFDNVPATGTKA